MTVAVPYLRTQRTPLWLANDLWRRAGAVPSWHIAPARTGDIQDLVTGQQLVTFTNSSPAWGFDSSGLLVQPAANTPFLEFNPATRECLGWRIWEPVINLGLHSRDLTQTQWVKSGITPTRDQVGADGTANTATRLTATSSDGTILQTITGASATRVSGFLLRRITGTGTIEITQNGGATWTAVSISNQWLRYSVASAVIANPQFGIRIRSSGDEVAVDFAQLQSAPALGPPVVTTGVTASSTADVATITGAAFSSLYRQNEWMMFAEASGSSNLDSTSISIAPASFNNGTNSERIRIGLAFNQAIWVTGNVSQVTLASGPGFAANSIFRMVAANRDNNVAFTVNGFAVQTASIASIPSVTQLSIGSSSPGAGYLNGHLRALALWPTRSSNPNMQLLSR